jgi:hypothetical protein
VVETGGLENRCTGNRTGGSNPSPSARSYLQKDGAVSSFTFGLVECGIGHREYLFFAGDAGDGRRPDAGSYRNFILVG